MSTTSAYEDATKFADDFIALHAALALARAAHADVKKKTEAKNFFTVQWNTLEKGPIDADAVLSKLEADIKEKEPAFVATKEGLEETLSRMHQGEHILWWNHCERLFSSVEPLKEYKPVVETLVIEEDDESDAIEDDGVEDGATEEDGPEEDGAEEVGAEKNVTEVDEADEESVDVETAEVASEDEAADEE